jgi:hypothetical protein
VANAGYTFPLPVSGILRNPPQPAPPKAGAVIAVVRGTSGGGSRIGIKSRWRNLPGGTIMSVDADSITLFLAHLSLNPTEASAYLNDPVGYLDSGKVTLLSPTKKNVLKSKDKQTIDAAIADEQKGAIRGAFSFGPAVYAVVYATVTSATGGQGGTQST